MTHSNPILIARQILESIAPELKGIEETSSIFLSGRLSSLQAIQMIVELEQSVGKSKKLEIHTVADIDTLQKVSAILVSQGASD